MLLQHVYGIIHSKSGLSQVVRRDEWIAGEEERWTKTTTQRKQSEHSKLAISIPPNASSPRWLQIAAVSSMGKGGGGQRACTTG